MIQTLCHVSSIEHIRSNIYVMGFGSSEIASSSMAGQFVNIKVNETYQPLFRRPFSIYHIEGENVKIIFQVFGQGTKALIQKQLSEKIDVIGPLGRGYNVRDDFETALLVGGGLGVAPLPILTNQLRTKRIVTFLGGRTKEQILPTYLENVQIATDDGSAGYKGTVVDLLEKYLVQEQVVKPKIFACGPNVMLKVLGKLAAKRSIPCEVSLETVMACGIGICQGCPVERTDGRKKYSLVCKEGPVFDVQSVVFPL
ncbi:MAG: dihydroorotate dehydrogenase electron transfer subunit [Bacteroidetes bacterium]|nr:MAG: dihydroorotate dehydrogenase electron transfer subunit [Bacteroidota bacterium]